MSPIQKVIKYCGMAFAILLIVSIFTGIAGVVLGVTNIGSFSSASKESVSYSTEFNNVKSIEIDCADIDITIQTGDKFAVDATNVPENYIAEVSNDGTLEIGYEGRDGWRIFSFDFFDSDRDAQLTLTIPTDFVADEVDINGGSGRLTMDGVNAKRLALVCGSGGTRVSKFKADKVDIDSGSGEITFEKVTFSKVAINTGSGSMTMQEAELTNLDMDCGSGAVNISGILIGDNEIAAGSGNLSLSIEDSIDNFDFTCDAGSGGIWVNGEKVNDYIRHNITAKNSLDIDGGSGRVSLDFK